MPDDKNKVVALANERPSEIAALIDGRDRTLHETAVDPKSMHAPWNTDDLYQKRGNYSIYEEMRLDDQVSICMQLKKDMIIGNGWEITSDENDQQDICRELDACLRDHAETVLEDRLMEIMTAYDYGFSVTEKQFKTTEDNKLALKCLKTRDPISWLFHQDKYGNIIRYEQMGATGEFADIDPKALIHFINKQEFGNPYGRSDLRVAYTAWFCKTQIVKFYAIYLEKAASPIPVGKYERSMMNDDQTLKKIYNTLKKFQSATAMMIPKDVEIEFLEAKSTGDAYKMAIDLFNMFIGRALFVPDLLGFQGPETAGGSYALGKDQILVFMRHINQRRRSLEGLVNREIIKPLVMWNYGEVEKCPYWKLLPINEEQAVEFAKLWLELVSKAGHVASLEEINYFKRVIQFPETSEEEWEELKAEKEAKAVEEKEMALAKIAGAAAGKVPPGNKPAEKFSHDTEDAKAPDPKCQERADYKHDDEIGSFHTKTDFQKIERMLDEAEASFSRVMMPIVKETIDLYVEEIRRSSGSVAAAAIPFSAGKIESVRMVLRENFLSLYRAAQVVAQEEVSRDDFARLVPEETFLQALMQENDGFIRDWEYGITKQTRVTLLSAIKQGLPISEVTNVIHREGMELSRVQMERYARTKFTEVMNRARLAHFEQTGVVAAYQYSAILDGRTSVICRGLHGKVFAAGTQPTPPMHFSCRSILIPITRFEDWNADGKIDGEDIQAFIEKNKGRGF